MTLKLYFYAKKSEHGDWLEFIHKVNTETDARLISHSEFGKTYRLAVRREIADSIDALGIQEGQVLCVECEDAWVDVRPEFEKLHLLRVKNPSCNIKQD